MVAQIAITVVAFIIGLFGIALLIGVGEALNNAVAAFAAVSFPFAFLAGFFSWLLPRARWAVAVAITASVVILSCISMSMGGIYFAGAMWTVMCGLAGAYLGGQLKQSRHSLPPTAQE